MRTNRWTRWLGVAGWLWLGVAGLLLAGCRPGTTAAGPVARYTFYLAEEFLGGAFVPLDAETLADAGQPRPAPGLVSADGRAAVSVTHTAGRANIDPQTVWIAVSDGPGGAERARFHPPVSGWPAGLSADGSRLLWQPPPPPGRYPPLVEFFVLDTASGQTVAHVRDETNACFRQVALLDPAGTRLYCAGDPSYAPGDGVAPLRLLAYDLVAAAAPVDRPAGELVVSDALIGQRGVGEAEWELLEPALALSPDGRTLAVVHAESETITLVDAAGLTPIRAIPLARPRGLWELLGLVEAAGAKGIAAGTLRQAVFSAGGDTLYVFSQILTRPDDAAPETRGLLAVDVARGRVMAGALGDYQIQWLRPAPDGTLYAFGTADANLHPFEIREDSPSRLWRLDGRTLATLAERSSAGYRGGRIMTNDE